jgi:hypothetical protein
MIGREGPSNNPTICRRRCEETQISIRKKVRDSLPRLLPSEEWRAEVRTCFSFKYDSDLNSTAEYTPLGFQKCKLHQRINNLTIQRGKLRGITCTTRALQTKFVHIENIHKCEQLTKIKIFSHGTC